MYIRGQIPRNFAELAEAVLIATLRASGRYVIVMFPGHIHLFSEKLNQYPVNKIKKN